MSQSDMWFLPHWNEYSAVTEGLAFPDAIEIHDITLRDGEQQAGIEFSREEKVDIAKRLAKAGVHRIEAGMPAVSPTDEAAIRDIVQLDLPARIFAFSRCMVSDVELAADCGVEGVIVEAHSVISMGVFLGASTKIYDRASGQVSYGRVPSGSVVVPGSLPSSDGTHSLACAVIVKRVDAKWKQYFLA